MRVAHLSYMASGGAYIAARRLHLALTEFGADSKLYTLLGKDAVTGWQRLDANVETCVRHLFHRSRNWLRNQVRRRADATFEIFSDDRGVLSADALELQCDADVIVLHWAARLVEFGALERLAAHRPVVWCLHDMNPFTGGCHYDNGCGRFGDQCGKCPQLGSDADDDLSRRVWMRKRQALEHVSSDGLILVAPSRWMAEQATRSSLMGAFTCHTIPYGVNTQSFVPGDRFEARRSLGIGDRDRVIATVAADLSNPRKGVNQLMAALRRLQRRVDTRVLLVGEAGPMDAPLPLTVAGRLTSQSAIVQAYRAADVFVIPSLQDNLPNTVLEAMACGVPVVGFDVGGVGDMIVDGETGRLVDPGDIEGLASVLDELLDDLPHAQGMGAMARRRIEAQFTAEQQVERHLEVYCQLREGFMRG